ncbi:unnamed protein product [Staurois parvus]|uniref:Uncharacterized protein n=1 Tax=Staurois parvus TaxID=386267 RepID=A0ABN9D0Q8_9NEOB|nr:unnamed protein product [Staurois parvus]
MSPLQRPQPSPLADADIRLPCSSPCERRYVRDVRGTEPPGKFENFKNKTLVSQTISHTFCPECFVLCPACIFTVLSAWKLRKVHGVQKASL